QARDARGRRAVVTTAGIRVEGYARAGETRAGVLAEALTRHAHLVGKAAPTGRLAHADDTVVDTLRVGVARVLGRRAAARECDPHQRHPACAANEHAPPSTLPRAPLHRLPCPCPCPIGYDFARCTLARSRCC